MTPRVLTAGCATLLLLAACATNPGPAASPLPIASSGGSGGPDWGGGGMPTAQPIPSVAPSPSPDLGEAVVLGSIATLEGGALDSARLLLESSSHPQLNGERQVPGVFSFRAPVGARLRLTVDAPGFGPRTRTWVVQAADGAGGEGNRVDFGGTGSGKLHALVRHPEIVRTEPAHGATGVQANPLAVRMVFSKKLRADERDLLRKLVMLEVGGGAKIVPGTSYNDQRADLLWAEDGLSATFTFAAPLVTRLGETGSVRLAFDASLAESQWPQDEAGFRLGFKKVVGARDGNGLVAPTQVAPLLATVFPSPPARTLEPEDVWALSHAVSAQFSLAPDRVAPRVQRVRVVPKALSDGRGEIYVQFSEPMRGFPEELLDGSANKASAYRLVLGTTKARDPREEFEAADPKQGGIGPSEAIFDPLHPETVILRMAAGVLERYTDFKLYVETSVKDPGGNAVAADLDASTGRPANLIVGKVE